MTEQGRQSAPTDEATEAQRLAGVVLVRIATEPADEAAVSRDLGVILGSRAGSDLWRIELSRLVAALVAGGLVERDLVGLRATATGLVAATEFLGCRKGLPANWATARDIHLVARALDLDQGPASRLKLLRKPEGLRALIVAHHWQLRIKGQPSPQRLRAALAAKALGRAFGNQVGTSVGDKSSLPAKAARLLAAQLSSSGREFSSDGRLVAALAAEAVDSRRSDAKSLQLAVLRRFLGRTETGETRRRPRRRLATNRADQQAVSAPAHVAALPPPANLSPGPPGNGTVSTPRADPPAATTHRPSPSAFAAAVRTAADEISDGWAGNRKAFISKVWAVIRDRYPGWDLTEIEFKCMLAEAHRTGLVALANADLKDKRALKELNDSAVVYKNTVWHYVRATD